MALAIFTVVIYLFSRFHRFRAVSAKRCAYFLMFLGTIGIVILLCETPWSPFVVRFYVPPIGGLISIIYLMEFIHEQAVIGRVSSTVISIVSLAFYFAFRGLTMQ
jgi:hypothetical protein